MILSAIRHYHRAVVSFRSDRRATAQASPYPFFNWYIYLVCQTASVSSSLRGPSILLERGQHLDVRTFKKKKCAGIIHIKQRVNKDGNKPVALNRSVLDSLLCTSSQYRVFVPTLCNSYKCNHTPSCALPLIPPSPATYKDDYHYGSWHHPCKSQPCRRNAEHTAPSWHC